MVGIGWSRSFFYVTMTAVLAYVANNRSPWMPSLMEPDFVLLMVFSSFLLKTSVNFDFTRSKFMSDSEQANSRD